MLNNRYLIQIKDHWCHNRHECDEGKGVSTYELFY